MSTLSLNRSVGEPAEGSLTSRGGDLCKGVISHLATLVYLHLLLWWTRREAAGELLVSGSVFTKVLTKSKVVFAV